MVSAALFLSRLPSPPPVIRHFKKGAKATFQVLEKAGEGDGAAEARYWVQIKIGKNDAATGVIFGRNLRVNGDRMGGLPARTGLVLDIPKFGPCAGLFDVGMGGGNSLVWALSIPGWGGTGFKGATTGFGWKGEALFGDANATSSVHLNSVVGKDGWPREATVEISTPQGGYTAQIRRV